MQKISISFFKDQKNVINNNRENGAKTEDGIKTEDSEIIDNVYNRYILDKYQDLINNISTHGLKDKYMHLTKFDSRINLKNIANRYLTKKNAAVYDRFFTFEKSIKGLTNIDNRLYKPKTDIEFYDKKDLLAF